MQFRVGVGVACFAAILIVGTRAGAQDELVAGAYQQVACPPQSGVAATSVSVSPTAMAFGPDGFLYIADKSCYPSTIDNPVVIRRIDVLSKTITTVVTLAPVSGTSLVPYDMAVSPSGNLYLAFGVSLPSAYAGGSTTPGGIWSVDLTTGALTRVFSTYSAAGLAFDSQGRAITVENDRGVLLRVDVDTGSAATLASGLNYRYIPSKGAPALASAQVSLDGNGNIFATDYGGGRILRVDAKTANVTTVATIGSPTSVLSDASGNLFSYSLYVDASSGRITTVDRYLTPPAVFGPDGKLYYYASSLVVRFQPVAPDIVTPPPDFVDFGDVAVSQPKAQAIVLKNLSSHGATISFTPPAPPFSVTSDCPTPPETLAVNATCVVTVTFTPPPPVLASNAVLLGTEGTFRILVTGRSWTIRLAGRSTSAAQLNFEPASVDFGQQRIGTVSAPRTVTITNVGTGPAKFRTILPYLIKGTRIDDNFQIVGGSCPPYFLPGLPPGESCISQVAFSPKRAGAIAGEVRSYDDTAGTPHVVALSGTAVGPSGSCSSFLEFGFGVQAGVMTSPKILTISSVGTEDLMIGNISGLPQEVHVANHCTVPVPPGSKCTLEFVWTPPNSADITPVPISIETNSIPLSVRLIGSAVGLRISPSPASFPATALGSTREADIQISTPSALHNPQLTVTGSDFRLSRNTCVPDAVGTCGITIVFSPSAIGARSGRLTLTGTFDNVNAVSFGAELTGIGAESPLGLDRSSLEFNTTTFVGEKSDVMFLNLENTTGSPQPAAAARAIGDFSLLSEPCSGQEIPPFGRCPLNVFFKPTRSGAATGSLMVTSPSLSFPLLAALKGAATVPALTFSPSYVDFGTVGYRAEVPDRQITVKNNSPFDVSLSNYSYSGNPLACGYALSPFGSCIITAHIDTTSKNSPSSLTISAMETAGAGVNAAKRVYTVPVTGKVAFPEPLTLPSKIDFGVLDVGSSAAQTFTVANNTSSDAQVTQIAAGGDLSQTNDCPAQLPPGAICTLTVRFSPTAPGPRGRSIQFTFSDRPFQLVQAVATGRGVALGITPASLRFPSTSVGKTAVLNMVVWARAAVNYSFSVTGDFTYSAYAPAAYGGYRACGSESAATACSVSVTFSPKAAGPRTGTLTISTGLSSGVDTGAPYTISLSGAGLLPPTADLSATSLDFGYVMAGNAATGSGVILKNNGTSELSISRIYLAGSGAADFGQTSDCGASLAGGSQCSINITFRPTTTGLRTATLWVSSNASGNHFVQLGGGGLPINGTVLLSRAWLFFEQRVGTTSPEQSVSLKNIGAAPLTISSITGWKIYFPVTHDCPASLASGAQCTIKVVFIPTYVGDEGGLLTVVTNAADSPHLVGLNGIGVSP